MPFITAAEVRGILIPLHSYAAAARKMSTLTITESIISLSKKSPPFIICRKINCDTYKTKSNIIPKKFHSTVEKLSTHC